MVIAYALLSAYREQKALTLVTSSIIRQCGSLELSILDVSGIAVYRCLSKGSLESRTLFEKS
jgi:hypothetical protein